MKSLSDAIRDGRESDPNGPTYAEVIAWFDDLAAAVQSEIRRLDFEPLLNDVPIELSSRAKTIDTLRDKLNKRPPYLHVHTVRDVAGVRFEAEMDLDQQDGVVNAIVGALGDSKTIVKDLREDAHSGYRAVHVWLELPARVEVQVRTHLQSQWANAYESMADVLGRNIRYDGLPKTTQGKLAVSAMRAVSTDLVSEMEGIRKTIGSLRLDLEDERRRLLGIHGPQSGHVRNRGAWRKFRQLSTQSQKLEHAYRSREKTLSAQLKDIEQRYATLTRKER
jgi:ppGpp synthetase/RelA/SpoT-type nucleotidyltranferase